VTAADRTPKPCRHKYTRHQHGTREAYLQDECRCSPCSAANAAYQRRRHRTAAYGRTPTGWVDATPVRAHVENLRAAGLGRTEIAARAGLDGAVVYCLLHGRNGRPPTRRVAARTAQQLLAVPLPDVDDLAHGTAIDGTGTRRRLQALVALGWSQTALACRLDWSKANLGRVLHGRGGGRVTVRTRAAVHALYEQLSMSPAPTTYGSDQARAHAAHRGWPSPLAWDDDTIDDPAAGPVLEVDDRQDDDVDEFAVELVLDGQPMRLTGRELEEAALRLSERGLDYAAIAARVRSDEATIRRVLNTVRARAARAATRKAAA
jgi:transcriptional regulator with XRE-family HTH domain